MTWYVIVKLTPVVIGQVISQYIVRKDLKLVCGAINKALNFFVPRLWFVYFLDKNDSFTRIRGQCRFGTLPIPVIQGLLRPGPVLLSRTELLRWPELLTRPVRLVVIRRRRETELIILTKRRRRRVMTGLVGEASGVALPEAEIGVPDWPDVRVSGHVLASPAAWVRSVRGASLPLVSTTSKLLEEEEAIIR